MKLKIFLILLLTITLFSKDYKIENLKINYLNLDSFIYKDMLKKDKDFFKEFTKKTAMTIFNNIQDKNSLDYMALPGNFYYSNNLKYDGNTKYSAILLNDSYNEYIKLKRVDYQDDKNLFDNDKISGFLINGKYMIYIINFSNKRDKKEREELIQKVENLNYVVKWSRKKYQIKRSHIMFIGSFGLSDNDLKNKVYGFSPVLHSGTKIVKYKRKYKLMKVENVLLSNNSVFSARIKFFIRNDILKGKYKKKLKSYIRAVTPFYPIEVTIHNFKKKRAYK